MTRYCDGGKVIRPETAIVGDYNYNHTLKTPYTRAFNCCIVSFFLCAKINLANLP